MIFRLIILSIFFAACTPAKHAGSGGGVTIMTYNIHHANPPSKPNFIDLDAIAAVINKEKPGIVMLQEVDVNTGRSKINEASLLAEKNENEFLFRQSHRS